MKLIKLAFFSIIILFVIVTLLGLLFPAKVLVSRAVNINTSKDSVLVHLKSINEWKSWIEGMNKESVKVFSDSTANLAGVNVKITKIDTASVVSEWLGDKGSLQLSTMNTIVTPASPVTIVQWQFEQHLKWYPWERFGSMMNDKILGTMMEKNLDNLRKLCERN